MALEAINGSLFEMINARAELSGLPLGLAKLAAKGAIGILAALLILRSLYAEPHERRARTHLVIAVPLALALNYVIGLVYPHPCPFMIGVGHTFLAHAPESSFPSDHDTAMWTVAFGMLTWARAK